MDVLAQWKPTFDGYCSEPASVVHRDVVWLGLSERVEGQERVTLRRLGRLDQMETWEPTPKALYTGVPGTSSPVLATDQEQGVMAWLAFEGGDPLGKMRLDWMPLQGKRARPGLLSADSIRHPSIVVHKGALHVAAVCLDGESWALSYLVFDLGNEEVVHQQVTTGLDVLARPSLHVSDERVIAIWESHQTGTIDLTVASAPLGEPLRLSGAIRDAGYLQNPKIVQASEDRYWLTYNHDGIEPPPSISRWTEVRELCFADDGEWSVRAPSEAAPGMDLKRAGEDQSLEFATPAVMGQDDLVLVARASHNFRLQRYKGQTWSDLQELDAVLWGCRGIRLNVHPIDRQKLLVLAHGRRGVTALALALDGVQTSVPAPLVPVTADTKQLAPVPKLERALWANRGAFFGDIHFHTAHSDGVGTVEEAYRRARDRYGDDFACLTEHDAFLSRRVTDQVWRQMKDVAENFDRADDFATIVGIEYTGTRFPGPGHKNLYFDDASAPLVCKWDGLEDPADLLQRVKEVGGFAIPHHVGWLGGDPEHHDPSVQPCWEIVSCHGQYECEKDEAHAPPIGYREGLEGDKEALRGHFVRRQLEKGARFGFVGGSDGHGLLWHHGISRKADSHRTGVTGVWLETLGRAEILEAIRTRRTFATSGGKVALGFTCNNAWMGAEIPYSEEVELDVRFRATEEVKGIEVFACAPEGTIRLATHTPEVLDGKWKLAARPGAAHALYVRLVQADDEVAWASPVFFDRP